MTPKDLRNLNIGVTWYQCLTDKKKNNPLFFAYFSVLREVTLRLFDKIQMLCLTLPPPSDPTGAPQITRSASFVLHPPAALLYPQLIRHLHLFIPSIIFFCRFFSRRIS